MINCYQCRHWGELQSDGCKGICYDKRRRILHAINTDGFILREISLLTDRKASCAEGVKSKRV